MRSSSTTSHSSRSLDPLSRINFVSIQRFENVYLILKNTLKKFKILEKEKKKNYNSWIEAKYK